MTTNKTREIYIAALYGITPKQQQELRQGIHLVWMRIGGEILQDYRTLTRLEASQLMVEKCVDANRLSIWTDESFDWLYKLERPMLCAYDVMDVIPYDIYVEEAKEANIEMWVSKRNQQLELDCA
jgi:hypothetical protein